MKAKIVEYLPQYLIWGEEAPNIGNAYAFQADIIKGKLPIGTEVEVVPADSGRWTIVEVVGQTKDVIDA